MWFRYNFLLFSAQDLFNVWIVIDIVRAAGPKLFDHIDKLAWHYLIPHPLALQGAPEIVIAKCPIGQMLLWLANSLLVNCRWVKWRRANWLSTKYLAPDPPETCQTTTTT